MRTAAVTGIGVAAPNGLGTERYWAATLAGRSGLGPITRFDPSTYPIRVAGEVPGFTASEHVPGQVIPQTDNWTHLGLAAALWALSDAAADLEHYSEYDMAVVTASSSGGTEFGQREIERLWQRGPRAVGAYQSIAWFYAATTGQISIQHGMRGPCSVICAEQAGGLEAAGQARQLIGQGRRLVITGGTDASLCPYGVTAQLSKNTISEVADPGRAYLPFDVAASGHVPGEGGAMLVVEEAGEAYARSVPQVYGLISGQASTFDPAPGSPRPPGLRRAIELALDDAGLDAGAIDVVFADAAGVPEQDRQEAAALTAVFGPAGVAVTGPKTMTGRLNAGGAALDLATACLSLRDQVIPPTVAVRRLAADCQIDLVRDIPREAPLRHALVVARGHGGFNSAAVVSRPLQ